MKQIHIGHHFYGSGNLGDDLMLDGFLSQFTTTEATFSCCTPYESKQLENRFPQIKWLPYTDKDRLKAIKESDIWLGLGGSPFQNSVSPWFTEHLVTEANLCTRSKTPMLYLGIGSQDKEAFNDTRLMGVINQSKRIWTRDEATHSKLLSHGLSKDQALIGSDLAHICFSNYCISTPKPGRITATLNFDYSDWDNLMPTLQALDNTIYSEKIWLIQEMRNLKGAEQYLYNLLPPDLQKNWVPQFADYAFKSMQEVVSLWPSSEWALSSRYHTTLASAWAGSKVVVIATNDKLKHGAIECGYPFLDKSSSPKQIIKALQSSTIPSQNEMNKRANLAKTAVNEFKAFIIQEC